MILLWMKEVTGGCSSECRAFKTPLYRALYKLKKAQALIEDASPFLPYKDSLPGAQVSQESEYLTKDVCQIHPLLAGSASASSDQQRAHAAAISHTSQPDLDDIISVKQQKSQSITFDHLNAKIEPDRICVHKLCNASTPLKDHSNCCLSDEVNSTSSATTSAKGFGMTSKSFHAYRDDQENRQHPQSSPSLDSQPSCRPESFAGIDRKRQTLPNGDNPHHSSMPPSVDRSSSTTKQQSEASNPGYPAVISESMEFADDDQAWLEMVCVALFSLRLLFCAPP